MRESRGLWSSLLALGVILRVGGGMTWAAPPGPERVAIFPPEPKHNHASCVVEMADGSLLAAWYSGSGERKSDDVVIQGAWLRKGSKSWEPRFLMADTPGYPDCNPALFAAPDGSLWLFWPTILDHRWEGALLKYAAMRPSFTRRGCSEMVVHGCPSCDTQGLRQRDAARDRRSQR